MRKRPEFNFEELLPGCKGVYQLTVEVEEEKDLTEPILFSSSDLVSRGSIQNEVFSRFREKTLSLPVLAACGAEPGKILVATAGVHGDEYEGMEAIYRTFDIIDPAKMKGTFVAVPVVTLPAFWLGSRVNPLDGCNMARVFPGSDQGSASQRIAARLLNTVLSHASLYIDLHSAGHNNSMLTLCGFFGWGTQGPRAREAARCFGAPVIWEHPGKHAAGRTLSATIALGIPSLYTEAYGGGHARREDVECYARGLANLLRFLGVVSLPAAGFPDPYRPLEFYGSGDLDYAVNSSQAGLFSAQVNLGDRVSSGQCLGRIRDLEGKVVEEILSPEDGVVILIRSMPRIFAGEIVATLT